MHLLIERIAARKHCFVVVIDRYLVGQASLRRQREATAEGKFLHRPQLLSAHNPMPRWCPLAVECPDEAIARGSKGIRFQGSNVSYPALTQALTAIVFHVVAIHGKGGWLLEALNDFSPFQDNH